MSNLVKSVLFGIGILWISSCKPQNEGTIAKIDKATVEAEVIGKDVQWVDVRTPGEYKDGYIDDAVNFDIKGAGFMEQINTLDKEKPVYLYCRRGTRSNNAAEILKSKGFSKIFDYSGGYDDWVAKD